MYGKYSNFFKLSASNNAFFSTKTEMHSKAGLQKTLREYILTFLTLHAPCVGILEHA